MSEFLDDMLDLKEFFAEHSYLFPNDYEAVDARIQGYICKAHYDSGDADISNEIFEKIKDKIDKPFNFVLRSQYIEKIQYEEFDPSEYDDERAIEILEYFKKVKRKDTNKYVEIELRIAEMNLLKYDVDHYEEALYKFENASALVVQFRDEVVYDPIDIFEKVADVCDILNNALKRRRYMRKAVDYATQMNYNKSTVNYLKEKYKHGTPNLIMKQNKVERFPTGNKK